MPKHAMNLISDRAARECERLINITIHELVLLINITIHELVFINNHIVNDAIEEASDCLITTQNNLDQVAHILAKAKRNADRANAGLCAGPSAICH